MHTATPAFTSSEDPFVVLEQTSTTTKSFTEFGKFNHSGRTEPAVSSNCSPPLTPYAQCKDACGASFGVEDEV